MADNVTVTTAEDVITVVDPTTSVPVSIIEEIVSVGSGVDQINVTATEETVQVTEVTDSTVVTDVQEIIQPQVAEVQVQIVEDSNVPYAKRTDFITGTDDIYRGDAAVGSAESAAVWRIRKLEINAEGDVTELWAAGTASFDKIWDDRASEAYS